MLAVPELRSQIAFHFGVHAADDFEMHLRRSDGVSRPWSGLRELQLPKH